jgi:hypothetical protein
MKKTSSPFYPNLYLILGWIAITLIAYGRLLLNPDLHTACPENDTWNLPIRWSVLSTLRDGQIPLWNSLSAFGIPWLATWQTETFYPGTLLFKWFGLSFWNYSGVLHLLIFSLGLYRFLRNLKVEPFWAFFAAAISLLNGCAYNHLGSNSSMDTMAWMPWLFVATQGILERKRFSGILFSLFLALQILAGYPQIIFYTLVGCLAYVVFQKDWKASHLFLLPVAGALLLSATQWIPSVEYFFLHCVRLPAVRDNPHFLLPLENLWTFLDFNALWKGSIPDYVVSPTFFYFNFYSGLIPLGLLAWGLFRWKKLQGATRFFLAGFFFLMLWAWGLFAKGADLAHLPFPGFLEPAKCWVLISLFELTAVGLLLADLFPKPGKWKWGLLGLAILNLLVPIWNHPLEKNLIPPNAQLETEAQKLKANLGGGRILILPDEKERAGLYTPLPDPDLKPGFKRFVPNSNLFAGLPLASFYGSTWPTLGAMNAVRYFQSGFPYQEGDLMDLLGVDLLYLPDGPTAPPFEKIQSDGAWTLWKNRGSSGSHFTVMTEPRMGTSKEIFEAFASGKAHHLKDLYMEPSHSSPPRRSIPFTSKPPGTIDLALEKYGFLVVTQNAMPGWRAWMDGIPSAVFRADGLFQCVPVPQGIHWVKLRYEPASFRFGLFLSLLALGFGGVGLARRLQRLGG